MDSWIKKDLKYIWHPYTQMKDLEELPPILIERAQGVKLFDSRGNIYYDTISSWWCNVHGHCHLKIRSAINKQLNSLDHLLFAGFTHRPAILLAEKLIQIAPQGFSRVFYSDNGSTAVEVALKMSFQYWQNKGKRERRRFISLMNAYHGDTIGAMSLSGISLFNQNFSPLLFETIKIPSPYCYRCPMGKNKVSCHIDCIQPLEHILKESSREIAGLILEPLVMAAGGMIVYPPEYLKRVAELTKTYGIHLILDEVATGFGRTGKMFACQHLDNIEADFICLSKGITSGTLPLAVTLTREEIFLAFYADYEKKKTFYHGHTYTANPISCSAALASLEIFEEENTLEKANKLMPEFHNALDKLRELDFVGDVRYLGMIGAVELVKEKKKKKPFDFRERMGLKIYKTALKQGLILRPLGDVIYLFLPLAVKKQELKTILSRVYEVLRRLSSF